MEYITLYNYFIFCLSFAITSYFTVYRPCLVVAHKKLNKRRSISVEIFSFILWMIQATIAAPIMIPEFLFRQKGLKKAIVNLLLKENSKNT